MKVNCPIDNSADEKKKHFPIFFVLNSFLKLCKKSRKRATSVERKQHVRSGILFKHPTGNSADACTFRALLTENKNKITIRGLQKSLFFSTVSDFVCATIKKARAEGRQRKRDRNLLFVDF